MASTIKIKRSSVAAKVPTTVDIATGELAINTKDKKIYSSNGTAVFSFTNDYIQVANAASTYLTKNNPVITGTLTANGSVGTAGYYLRTSGSGIYWSPVSANGGGGGGGGASWAALTSTNTAIRTLVDDRLQVANAAATYVLKNSAVFTGALTANGVSGVPGYYLRTSSSGIYWSPGGATWESLTGTNTALRTLISDRMQVANTKAYLANTNSFIKSQLANTNLYIATKASWTALTDTNTAVRTLISDRLQVANASSTYLTKSNPVITGTLTANGSTGTADYYLRTSGSGIYWSPVSAGGVSGATWAALTGTNTALRLLINDRYQVANVNTLLNDKATWTALTGTNTAIRTLVSDRYQVANVNTLLNAKATWTALTATNTAIRALVSDRYQVANVDTNFLKKSGTVPQTVVPNVSFSANVAIQGKLTVYGGVTTYSANNLVLGDNMIYLNSGNIVTNPDLGIAGNYNDGTYHHAGFFRDASDAGTWKVFENYSPEPDANTFINTAHASFKLAPFSARDARFTGILSVTANTSVGNTTVGGFLKLDGTDIRATFAQNTYVKTTLANTNLRVNLINTNLTGTNTALRTLISDRYQVANVNTLLNAKATWAGLTATNTAIRALDAQKLQVANATTLLLAKASWTGLTATNTALRTLISDRLQVANASSTYLTKNNPVITGTLTANASVGTAGYYLRTSGTGIYWSPVAGGGGSAANGFSGILVGANVVSADSTTDRLTLVAGSGITIAANPTTDTITFTATGGGGTFTGGTISGATTVTDATASTSNLTGAFKVTGGVGITGNLYVANKIGYASNTTSGNSAVYTYYNAATNSLDTVFG